MSENYDQDGKGFFYVRDHCSYDMYSVVKLGITRDYVSRDFVYATSEVKRGKYLLLVEMEKKKLNVVEKMMHNYFK